MLGNEAEKLPIKDIHCLPNNTKLKNSLIFSARIIFRLKRELKKAK